MAGRANAFDVISSELPKWWNDPNQEDLRDVASMVIPQDSSDLALSVLGGPFGRGAKMGAAAFGAAAYSPDAEAGGGGALRLLRRALRNSPEWSKRMLEKVASQTPNALEALDPGSLAHSLRYAREIRQMKPSEFLRAASPMGDTLADRDTVGALRQLLTQGYEGAYAGILDLPVDPYRRSFRGLLDVPYLGVVPEERIGSAYRGLTLDYPAREGVPKVVGHEGRHRMAAIRDVFGDTPIPVEIRSPWQSRYVENLPDSDWAVEQMARSRLVPPPTKYASGGVVGNMNAWLEQKKRQAKRTLSDWFERPEDTARMVASRFDEDMTKHLKDPAAALDYVTGPVGGLAGIMKPKGGNWLPGDIFDGVSTNAVRNAGFKPEGEFSIAELQDWAKANPEQLEEALFRDWMQYTDGDPVEARTLAKEYLSKVLDTNAREFFRNSRNHYAAGGLVQREEQGSGSQGGTTAVSSKNCSCHADGGLIESPGFQAYLKALGDHKDPAEEAAFYREFSRE